jgi:hypothetical protein
MSRLLAFGLLGGGAVLLAVGLASKKGNAANNAYNGTNSNGSGVSYTPQQFAQMANELYLAKSYIDDDEDAFYKVFESLKSENDLATLIYVFGQKSFFPFGSPMNLVEWVKSTLSPTEQMRVKAVFAKLNYPF